MSPSRRCGRIDSAQQRAAAIGVEIEHGPRELGQQQASDVRLERADHHHHVVVAIVQRFAVGRIVGGAVDEPAEDRRELTRIVDQQRQIDERQRRVLERQVGAQPALVGRIQVLRRTGDCCRLLARALEIHHPQHRRLRRTDVEHLGLRRHPRHDGADAGVEQPLGECRTLAHRLDRGGEQRAKRRPIAPGRAAIEFDRAHPRHI